MVWYAKSEYAKMKAGEKQNAKSPPYDLPGENGKGVDGIGFCFKSEIQDQALGNVTKWVWSKVGWGCSVRRTNVLRRGNSIYANPFFFGSGMPPAAWGG